MKTSHILQRYCLFLGNNIDVVQNVPCHFEQSEKSRKRLMLSSSEGYLGASLCRHDTNAEILVLVDNCYIISYKFSHIVISNICERTQISQFF